MKLLILDRTGRIALRLQHAMAARGHDVCETVDDSIALWRSDARTIDALVVCCEQVGQEDLDVLSGVGGGSDRVPVVLLAGAADEFDIVRSLDAGADDVVVSPVSGKELDARLRAIVRRATPDPGPVLEVGSLRLVADERRAWRANSELDLAPREFELLQCFMRHPGRLLTREFLLDGVWDIAYLGRSNVVDQAVSHVRRKIDRPFGRDDLQTVRGVGYRLRAS